MMARQGNNIYKRKDGRYEGRYIKGYNNEGRPIFGYIYDRDYMKCLNKLMNKKAMFADETGKTKGFVNSSVSEFMNYWQHNLINENVVESTKINYNTIVRKWVIPFLGDRKLNQLKRKDIQNFIDQISQEDIAPGTIHNVYRILHVAIKKAAELQYIDSDPCIGILLPKIEKRNTEKLDSQEKNKLITIAKQKKNGLPILLSLCMGLRIGEICALKWSDIDQNEGVMHISRTLRRVQNTAPEVQDRTFLIEERIRGKNSERTLTIPQNIMELLLLEKPQSQGDYVFSYHGHPLEPRTLQYRFKTMLKAANIKDINFRDLRSEFQAEETEQ